MWLNELEVYASPGVVKMLVANKIDKPGRLVSTQEGREFAQNRHMMFIEARYGMVWYGLSTLTHQQR